jgi:hypothetical protein
MCGLVRNLDGGPVRANSVPFRSSVNQTKDLPYHAMRKQMLDIPGESSKPIEELVRGIKEERCIHFVPITRRLTRELTRLLRGLVSRSVGLRSK